MPDGFIQPLSAALAAAEQKVGTIDFTLNKRKMVQTLGWSSAVVDQMEQQYRRFLALQAALKVERNSFTIVPNRLIDEFWHQHILDTQQYIADCEAIFGEYLHHYPYFGMIDATDAASWGNAAVESDRLWRTIYGEALHGAADPTADAYHLDREFHQRLSGAMLEEPAPARCRTQCKPVQCK